MENSKKWMKENGISSRISFNDGTAHTVKLIRDKEDTIPDAGGGNVQGMKYLVEEDGEQKTIFTGSVGLIGKLAEVESGTTVTIQMKKANNKSYYVVSKEGGEVVGEQDDQIADNEEPEENPDW